MEKKGKVVLEYDKSLWTCSITMSSRYQLKVYESNEAFGLDVI